MELHYYFAISLPRFSDNIDLVSFNREEIKILIESFCIEHRYKSYIAKNTSETLQIMINFSSKLSSLRIETTFRRSHISKSEYATINNIKVYTIDSLVGFKLNAFCQRNQIRDLFDCCYIVTNFYEKLCPVTINQYVNVFQYTRLEHLDYLVQTQSDGSIDIDKLKELFCDAYEKLALPGLYDNYISPKEIKNIALKIATSIYD